MGGAIVCGRGRELPFLTKGDLARNRWCCLASAEDGPAYCTCWEPVYDLDQAEPRADIEPTTRRTRCADCAFRPDSPERARGDDLEALPNFACHQGIRRPVAFRHPDGRVRKWFDDADYQPPLVNGIPFKADGTPADMCAGWAQAHRAQAGRA